MNKVAAGIVWRGGMLGRSWLLALLAVMGMLAIGVQAVRAADPVFPQDSYTFTIAEDVAQGNIVGRVKSSTAGAKHTLSDNATGFEIDEDSGDIRLKHILDYETTPSYSLKVNADLSGGNTDVPVTITVTDVASPVFAATSYSIEVAEDVVKGTPVGTVKSSTTDAKHALSGTYFMIGLTDGVIKLDTTLDYETGPKSYSLTVTATARGESTDVPLTITVTDVGPTFGKASYAFTVAENAAKATPVGAVTASPESGYTGVTYKLTDDTDASGLFEINETTGAITVKKGSNYENDKQKSQTLMVTATSTKVDSNKVIKGEETSVVVTITVTNVGPTFGADSYSFTVAENADLSADVGTVTASPETGFTSVEYTLKTSEDKNVVDFEIDKTSGAITVEKALDYEDEAKQSYTLKVTATSTGTGVDGNPKDVEGTSVSLTINVTDVGPKFSKSSYSFTVAEGAAKETKVGTVKALLEGDFAGYNRVEYALSGEGDTVFAIGKVSGIITVAGKVDYTNAKGNYNLNVRATPVSPQTGEGEPGNVSVTIKPPAPPATSSGGKTSTAKAPVVENPLGLTLVATGVPVGGTVHYTLVLTNGHDSELTNVTWRDATFDGAAQAVGSLAAGQSVIVAGSVGPVLEAHLPGIILTFVADSDQTAENLASAYVPLGATATPMAMELPGNRLLLTRDDGGAHLIIDIDSGYIRDASLGQTYAVVRRADGQVVRRWVSPNSPLVYQIDWAVVNTQFTVPTGVVAAILLDEQNPEPNMLARRFDGDDRIFSYDAQLMQWRQVPDIATFQSLGFYWCNVTAADAGFFGRVASGPAHPASEMPAQSDYPNCQTGSPPAG